MSDGTLSVRRRQPKASQTDASSDPFSLASLRAGTFESFLGGSLPAIGTGTIKRKGKERAKPIGDVDEFTVESRRKKKLREYDKLLKTFKYSAALDAVLRKVCHVFTGRAIFHFQYAECSGPFSKCLLRRLSRSFRS